MDKRKEYSMLHRIRLEKEAESAGMTVFRDSRDGRILSIQYEYEDDVEKWIRGRHKPQPRNEEDED